MKVNKSTLMGVTCATLFIPVNIDVAGLIVRPFDLILGVVAFLILFDRTTPHKWVKFAGNRIVLLIIFFSLLSSLSSLIFNPETFFKEIVQNIEYILLVYLIYVTSLGVKGRDEFLTSFFISISILALVAVGWHWINGYFVNYKMLNEPKLIFGLISIFLLCDYLTTGKKRGFLILSLLILFLSLERKAWIAMLLAIFVVSYIFTTRFKKHFRLFKIYTFVTVVVLLLGAVFFIQSNEIAARFSKQVNNILVLTRNFSIYEYETDVVGSQSNAARLYLIYFSYKSFLNNPIIGIGTGNFRKEIERFSKSEERSLVHEAHNEYQRILVENGLVGLSMYLLIILITFVKVIKIPSSYIYQTLTYRSSYLKVIGFLSYGVVINFFLAGGGINKFFFLVPLALVLSVRQEYFSQLQKA